METEVIEVEVATSHPVITCNALAAMIQKPRHFVTYQFKSGTLTKGVLLKDDVNNMPGLLVIIKDEKYYEFMKEYPHCRELNPIKTFRAKQ